MKAQKSKKTKESTSQTVNKDTTVAEMSAIKIRGISVCRYPYHFLLAEAVH